MRLPVVIGWTVLVVAGWGATLWLGEPTATAGPGPVPAPTGPYTAPGPQPQGGGPCSTPRATTRAIPSAAPSPASTARAPLGTKESGGQVVTRVCDYAVAR